MIYSYSNQLWNQWNCYYWYWYVYCPRSSDGLLGVSIVPELLHLLLDDPPLVVAGAVVVGVHKDAVQVPPQLELLMQDPINLGHSELLRDRRPRLNIEIFSLNSNIFSEFLFFSVSSLKLPAYGFALPPRQYCLRELFSKHLLGERRKQCCNEYSDSDSDSNLFLRIPNIRIRIRDFCKTNNIRIRIRNWILTSESESF